MRVVLLGAPGSGKGTQGALLSRHFGVPHVSSGELLRGIETNSDAGRRIAELLAQGSLAPDDLVLDLVADKITSIAGSGGYVLEGFPRTRRQAELAYKLAQPKGQAADAAVYLQVPDDVARRRLSGRANGARADDVDLPAIERRLQVFHENAEPLLDFYRRRNILVTVDADRPVDDVQQSILAALAAIT